MDNLLNEYILIKIFGCDMILYHIKKKKIVLDRHFDLLDLNKDLFSTYLNYYDDLPIVSNIKDLRYLRKLGIRM